ncbi:class I SAM-dependent methyltransferase [Amycolatopsis benzoatilytica]|uniref:class I SAM-dependent methyltransferase n=1 Tax=Amycolatopsis benzoatilytica TaxID=346045 RepID=UPI000375ED1F|nr:class I SAM-dependent methyltransferase [Amycolatopsis benzoatilytica]
MIEEYPFDNASAPAADRMSALQAGYDGVTVRHLADLGVGPGWACLELGAGGGSIARWLAAQVGPTGSVLATDVDLRLLADLPANATALRHDIRAEPMPDQLFDLIHARLVLIHFPERDELVAKLAAALSPGGWLVLEEIEPRGQTVVETPDEASAETFASVQGRIIDLLEREGSDVDWAGRLPQVLAGAGLGEVGSERVTTRWPGGGPEIRLLAANSVELAERLAAAGLAEDDLARFRKVLADPRFAVSSYPLVSAWGRRTSR